MVNVQLGEFSAIVQDSSEKAFKTLSDLVTKLSKRTENFEASNTSKDSEIKKLCEKVTYFEQKKKNLELKISTAEAV